MDPDNAQHFSLNLASAVDKVYQRNILSRQIFDALEVLCISSIRYLVYSLICLNCRNKVFTY